MTLIRALGTPLNAAARAPRPNASSCRPKMVRLISTWNTTATPKARNTAEGSPNIGVRPIARKSLGSRLMIEPWLTIWATP